MDWTKAKTILIVALLFTNIFLIGNYGMKVLGEESGQEESVLLQVLSDKNVELGIEIPQKHKNMPVLTVNYKEPDLDLIRHTLEAYSQIDGSNAYKVVADKFIKDVNCNSATMYYEGIEEKDNKVIVSYKNIVDEMEVQESYAKCIFENGNIVDFQYRWLKPAHFSSKKIHTISASAGLVKFMSEVADGTPIKVIEMKMVYWLADYDIQENSEGKDMAVSDTTFPAWQITYIKENNEKLVHYVEASDL